MLGDHDQGAVRRRRLPQLEVHPELRWPPRAKASRRATAVVSAGPATSKSMRMKNRSVSWSPNCWLSMMLPPCSTRNPVTACTMPGRSGQSRVSTKSPTGCSRSWSRRCSWRSLPVVATHVLRHQRFVVCDTQQRAALVSRHEQRSTRRLGALDGPVGRPGGDHPGDPGPRRRGRRHRDRRASSGCTRARRSAWSPRSSARPRRAERRPRQVPPRRRASSGWPAPPPPGSTSCRRPARSAGSWPRDTGETVNIAVLSDGAALYLDQVAGSSALQPHNWVGQHIPLHATSNGKVLLSGLEPRGGSTQVPARCRRTPPTTITKTAELRAELDEVREQGYAVAVDELEVGLTAVAAPIRNAHGDVMASLSVSGPDVPARREPGRRGGRPARGRGRRGVAPARLGAPLAVAGDAVT